MSVQRARLPAVTKPIVPPVGKHVMPALEGALNHLESELLSSLDPDKLNQLAECLFTLNSRRFGPIPGAYVVVCTQPAKRWCVGQLSADRGRPVVMFEDLEFKTPAAATRAAARLKRERGEASPIRSI